MTNVIFHRMHICAMQNNHTFNDSAGNWIAFVFGATFNLVTHTLDSGPASYLVHAIAGGIICLLFKLIGDLFTPLVQRLGLRITRWLEGKMF
jgi:CDP-diglyceride synthetase